jgi:outer membrane lipoprotein-sorting protein
VKEAKRTMGIKRRIMSTLLMCALSLGLLGGCTISDTLLSALVESMSTVLDEGLSDLLESLTSTSE